MFKSLCLTLSHWKTRKLSRENQNFRLRWYDRKTFLAELYISRAWILHLKVQNYFQLSPEESEVSGFGKADGYGEVKRRNSKDTRDTKDSKEGKISDQKRLFAATPTRAATAPVRSVHNAPAGLHKYAGRTKHKGLPDRMERIHPSSLKLAIVGPHTDRTNPGFSRKDDGTFYSVWRPFMSFWTIVVSHHYFFLIEY